GRQRLKLFDGEPDLDRILTESDERLHATPDNIVLDLAQSRARRRSHAEKACTVRVWIPVGAQKNVIVRAGARNDVDRIDAEKFRELRSEPKLFVRHAAGSNDGDFPTGEM